MTILIDSTACEEFVIHTDMGSLFVDNVPTVCPLCHHAIHIQNTLAVNHVNLSAKAISRTSINNKKHFELIFRCPRCFEAFIGKYFYSGGGARSANQSLYNLKALAPQSTKTEEAGEIISAISDRFDSIYRQAQIAEQSDLLEICGPGYRKALEILVKDYCIHRAVDDAEKIKKMFLGQCISVYVKDGSIKDMANRATWLGNDETHYERIWENHDLDDLKNLLDLTMGFIEQEIKAEQYKEAMDKGKS